MVKKNGIIYTFDMDSKTFEHFVKERLGSLVMAIRLHPTRLPVNVIDEHMTTYLFVEPARGIIYNTEGASVRKAFMPDDEVVEKVYTMTKISKEKQPKFKVGGSRNSLIPFIVLSTTRILKLYITEKYKGNFDKEDYNLSITNCRKHSDKDIDFKVNIIKA